MAELTFDQKVDELLEYSSHYTRSNVCGALGVTNGLHFVRERFSKMPEGQGLYATDHFLAKFETRHFIASVGTQHQLLYGWPACAGTCGPLRTIADHCGRTGTRRETAENMAATRLWRGW